jgi:hypothetical protein
MSDIADAFLRLAASVATAAAPAAGSVEAALASVLGQNRRADSAKVKALLLYASDAAPVAKAFNQWVLKLDAASAISVSNWEQIAKTLAKFQELDELTLLTHGHPGGFIFKSGHSETPTSFTRVAEFYSALPSLRRPAIDRISLQSCNVGLDPDSLLGFARLFKAKKITAPNHFYYAVDQPVTPQQRTTAAGIKRVLDHFGVYAAPSVTAEALSVNVTAPIKILVQWYRVELDNSKLPPPATVPGETNPERKPFKPVGTATHVTVSSRAEMTSLAEELRRFDFADPAKPLLLITLDVAALSQEERDGGT